MMTKTQQTNSNARLKRSTVEQQQPAMLSSRSNQRRSTISQSQKAQMLKNPQMYQTQTLGVQPQGKSVASLAKT